MSTEINQPCEKGRKPSTNRKGRKSKQPVEDLVISAVSEDQAMNMTDLDRILGKQQKDVTLKARASCPSQLSSGEQ